MSNRGWLRDVDPPRQKGAEYEPFGDEWSAYMMKLTKAQLVAMLRMAGKRHLAFSVGRGTAANTPPGKSKSGTSPAK